MRVRLAGGRDEKTPPFDPYTVFSERTAGCLKDLRLIRLFSLMKKKDRPSAALKPKNGAYGIRTRVTDVRGQRPGPLDECAIYRTPGKKPKASFFRAGEGSPSPVPIYSIGIPPLPQAGA
jgi:hypothetical protein